MITTLFKPRLSDEEIDITEKPNGDGCAIIITDFTKHIEIDLDKHDLKQLIKALESVSCNQS